MPMQKAEETKHVEALQEGLSALSSKECEPETERPCSVEER